MQKRKLSKLMSVALVVCALSTSVFASTSSGDVTYDNESYGSVYINAKRNNVYGETSASSSGSSSSDYVSVSAAGESKTNEGANYTTAWVRVSGTFSGTESVSGTVCRGDVCASGSTSASVS